MANPLYPIAAAAGIGLDFLTNYGDEGKRAEAKREKDWLDFNQRKQQPGFNAATDPYVIAGKNRHAQNPNMDAIQQAANAQPRLPNPNADAQRQAQIKRLESNSVLKAQFKQNYPDKYNELFGTPSSNPSTNVAYKLSFNGSTPPGDQGGNSNSSQPSNQGSMVASNRNNPTDLGHMSNKPKGNEFTGYAPYVSTASLLNPAQQQSQSSLLPEVTNRLRRPINFDDISRETQRKYEQEILPGIKAHFNRGTGKASSPDFLSQVHAGGQDLQTRLAAQRAEFEQNARTQDQNLFGTLMGTSQESFYNPGDPGLLKTLGSKALGKVTEYALDEGLGYLKNLFSSNPAQAASESAALVSKLSPDRKAQLVEYVTSGAGKSAPQAVKDSIIQNASPSAGSSTAANVALTAAGVAAAGVGAYYGSKWIRPLIFDQGE